MRSAHHPLRVGLLVDDLVVPGWIASVAAEILRSDFAKIAVAVVLRTRRRSRVRLEVPDPVELYLWLESLLFKPLPDALKPVDLSATVVRDEIPVIEAELVD